LEDVDEALGASAAARSGKERMMERERERERG